MKTSLSANSHVTRSTTHSPEYKKTSNTTPEWYIVDVRSVCTCVFHRKGTLNKNSYTEEVIKGSQVLRYSSHQKNKSRQHGIGSSKTAEPDFL